MLNKTLLRFASGAVPCERLRNIYGPLQPQEWLFGTPIGLHQPRLVHTPLTLLASGAVPCERARNMDNSPRH